MKIEILYLMDCPWCIKTKRMVSDVVKEFGLEVKVEEILIDSNEKAKKYRFFGSPTIRINGKDIQEKVEKARCLPCEKKAYEDKAGDYVKDQCRCGCRVYFYRGKTYPYPPKRMIRESIQSALGKE